jgi:hypothetical protein
MGDLGGIRLAASDRYSLGSSDPGPHRLHPENHEAHALIRQALTGNGVIHPRDSTLTIGSAPYQRSGPPPPSLNSVST